MKTYIKSLILLIIVSSCNKDWLDIKRDVNQVVPSSLKDLQAILDNTSVMNETVPYLGEISADDYYMTFETWSFFSIIPEYHNSYIWSKDIYDGKDMPKDSWGRAYHAIYYANVVLGGLDNLQIRKKEEEITKRKIKGQALFHRAWNYYHLAQLFCPPYDPLQAQNDLGLPLRLEADIDLPSSRATLADTYALIMTDLNESLHLLADIEENKTRPDKAAGYGLFARLMLQTGYYEEAKRYADSCLSYHSEILDFNRLDSMASFPIPLLNEEVIFQNLIGLNSVFVQGYFWVDSNLYSTYHYDDLRKSIYFTNMNNIPTYKGSFNGSYKCFGGLTSGEIYMIRAEANARLGIFQNAINDLNRLLIKRYKKEEFKPITLNDKESVLDFVLKERRKELIFRGLRWADLRRLNDDVRFAKPLSRKLFDKDYILLPKDKRYTLPIPDHVISISNIEQNER